MERKMSCLKQKKNKIIMTQECFIQHAPLSYFQKETSYVKLYKEVDQ